MSYERVFSFLDVGIKDSALFAGSVATNLDAWDPTNLDLSFSSIYTAPYAFTNTVSVGERIEPPTGVQQGLGGGYWAGYIMQTNGNAFDPYDYTDPFVSGFQAASHGSIIPVNAMPGNNSLAARRPMGRSLFTPTSLSRTARTLSGFIAASTPGCLRWRPARTARFPAPLILWFPPRPCRTCPLPTISMSRVWSVR